MRDINQFTGDALIIGGGWCASHQISKPFVRNKQNFFTADRSEKADPDIILDFETSDDYLKLPLQRFKFIYLEAFPFSNEKQMTTVFEHAHALLRPDGFLIYHGGSMSKTPIPELLKMAGFQCAEKKEIFHKGKKDVNENGSISIAADVDLNIIKDQQANYPDHIKHYLNYYKFFSPQPFSFGAHNLSETFSTMFYLPKFALETIKQSTPVESFKRFLPSH